MKLRSVFMAIECCKKRWQHMRLCNRRGTVTILNFLRAYLENVKFLAIPKVLIVSIKCKQFV